ncbi:MAG: zinc-binding dehydrogenase [Kiritimatiellae bacterium]|nr:zinc-binding dehydrogenase [Kiritimatiellia bacterium]MDW8458699.1 zinc-binding dehydrogenase [Verrucomicrobiota bacterium]
MKALAAVLVEQCKPLELVEIEIPPLRYGQVLVKVLVSGICGSQLGEIDGVKGPDPYIPHLLGHEGCGEVLECGDGVRRVRPGDRVVLHWRRASGIEAPTPRYSSSIGTINAGWVTTFNTLAVVSENRLTPVPQSLDPETSAMMGCAVTTAFGVVNNNARLRIGESIAVFGAGGIGLNIVQAAAMVSAHPIIAVDIHPGRVDLARQLGATHGFVADGRDLEAEIRDLVGKGGLDVAVDNTGHPRVIEMAYRLTSDRGRTILVGVPKKGELVSIYTLPLHFEKEIEGSHGGESIPDIDIPRYVRLVEAGKLDLSKLIGRRYPLQEINRAIDDMRTGAVNGRCMIYM